MRNRPFYQTGFGAKLTSLLYWIWCEIYLFTLLNLVRNRPKFGAKSTFLPLWIWCEINLNLVTNRHTIWKLTEFLRGENGFWSRQRVQHISKNPVARTDAAAACTDAAACSVVLSRDLVGAGWWGVVCTNIHGNSHYGFPIKGAEKRPPQHDIPLRTMKSYHHLIGNVSWV